MIFYTFTNIEQIVGTPCRNPVLEQSIQTNVVPKDDSKIFLFNHYIKLIIDQPWNFWLKSY